jgi:hypothetical protein
MDNRPMLLEADTGQCHVKINVNNIVAFEYHEGTVVISCVGGKNTSCLWPWMTPTRPTSFASG